MEDEKWQLFPLVEESIFGERFPRWEKQCLAAKWMLSPTSCWLELSSDLVGRCQRVNKSGEKHG